MDEFLKLISEEDISEPYSELLHIVGKEKVIEIAKVFGGSKIYFPKITSIKNSIRDKKIREEFDGYNSKELAKKYDLTETRVRQLCSSKSS